MAAIPATVITIVICAVGAMVVLHMLQHQTIEEIRTDRSRSARMLAIWVKDGRTLPQPPVATTPDALLQILQSADRRIVTQTDNLEGVGVLAVDWPEPGGITDSTICPERLQQCYIAIAVSARRPDGTAFTIISARPAPSLITEPAALAASVLLTLALVGVAGFGTRVVVGRALRPVKAIRAELAEITETSPYRRVPVPRGYSERDEIVRLAHTVNDTLDRLERALRSNQVFVADASHELRSPLTALRNRAEVALLHPDRADPADALQEIVNDADRLEALITDLLLLARLDSGFSDDAEPADLVAVVRHELAHRSRRVPVRPHLPDRPVPVRCGELPLSRVLTNLLDNAERHATTGVDITVRVDDSTAVLKVADDGPGIAPEDAERIFERFTRLDTGRGREQGGTGLGLAIARGIVTATGGTLRVPEPAGTGATFEVRLPVDSRPSAGRGTH